MIGGGLLGLEAANALRQFGLQAHIVERAPRLMNQQLDEAGSALLCRMVSGLGISVHLDVGTDSIERLGDDALHRSWLRRVANTSSTVSRPRCACVQAPIKKQASAFDDGVCLDDPSVAVPVYRTCLTADADVQVSV